MSTKIWDKIDKFYLMLAAVMLILTVLVVLSIRTIFISMQSLNTADSEAVESIGINTTALAEAIEYLTSNTTMPLDL